jgi:tetratricopeptide (TPR) repeat protein
LAALGARGGLPRIEPAGGMTRSGRLVTMLLADIMELLSNAHDAQARGEGYLTTGHYLKAIKALQQRSVHLPDSDEIRELQARAHVGFGRVLAERKLDRPQALVHFTAAIALVPELTGADPRRALVALVATAFTRRAALRLDEDPEAALGDYTRAVALHAQPREGEARDPQQAGALATSYLDRARLRLQIQDHDGAAADATAACEIFEQLRTGAGTDDRCGRGEALLVRGEARPAGEATLARADLDAAVAALEAPGAEGTAREQMMLAQILLGRGRWRRAAGDSTGAHADHARAVAVSELGVGSGEPDHPRALLRASALIHRASTHADQGVLTSTAADLDQARLILSSFLFTMPYLQITCLLAEISSSTAFQLRSDELLRVAFIDVKRIMGAVRGLGGVARLAPAMRGRFARLLDSYLAISLDDATREVFVSWRRSLEDA